MRRRGGQVTDGEALDLNKQILGIFVVALFVRLLVSAVKLAHGIWGPPLLELETFNDFNVIYVAQLHYLSQGYLPYRDFAYNYPPLFLYVLYPFYALAGATLAWVPIVLSDAGSAALIYLILRYYAGGRVALGAGLVYALSPFMVLYEGYLWFSSEPMVFFVLLSFRLLQVRRVSLAAICFGIAVLFKQDALFLFPGYLAALWYTHPRQIGRGVLTTSVVALIGCAPFLILAPSQFLTYISFSGLAAVGVPYVPPTISAPASTLTTAASIAPGTCATFSLGALSSICAPSASQSLLSGWITAFFGALTAIGSFLVLPLALLAGVALYMVRGKRGFVFLLGAYSSTLVFVLFAATVHPAFYRYYFLGVYSLLLAASWKRSLLGIVASATVISLVTPSGIFQEMLPLLAFLPIALTLDRDASSLEPEKREFR